VLLPPAPRFAELPPEALVLFLGTALPGDEELAVGTPVLAIVVDEAGVAALTARGVLPREVVWGDLRRLGASLGARDAGLVTQALALANWHRSAAFSPRTGRPTDSVLSGWVRRDPTDGSEYFPRTDAAIIVGVTDAEDRLLLGSNAVWESNRFSLLAGFVEPGESFEAAVEREIFEESGLRVVDPVYLGSQPWPFPASLMVGFRARLAEGEDPTGRPDGEEILELRWFSREELAAALDEILLPGPTSIARRIIEDWFGADIDDGQRAR
jgi:NAD+ diphosphatase